MAIRLPFSAGGLDGAFTALVGTVGATERASDTRVRGGGYVTSVNGQVFGNTKVTTDVTVTRDMWLHDAEGVEHHKRLVIDLPVRVGQRFAFIDYEGPTARSKRPKTFEIRIVNLSTDKGHEINSMKLLAQILSPMSIELFLLRMIEDMGLPAGLLLVLRKGLAMSARMVELQKVQDTLDARLRDVLALVAAEDGRLLPAPDTPAGPRVRSGAAI